MLSIEDVRAREPGPGEVRLRVRAAGVNFPDVLIIQKKYQLQPTPPFTPGAEAAGDVLAVGPDVANLEPGDRVACLCHVGGFAEELVVPAIMCVPIPDGVPDDVAGSFTLVYGTSWHAIRDRAAMRPGETMVVLDAAGGAGLAAVEIGKATGARVIAAASSDEKLRVCHAHGADATINYTTEDLREGIKRLTDGKGPDVVYDPVGGKYAELAFRSIGWRGRYLVIGFADGAIPTIAWNLPLLKGASIVGVFWDDFVRREPQNHQRDMADLLAWIREGKLRPLVSKSYSLEQTPLALSDMA